jgi:drug/metabolite transporter (DMT)-like permease
MHFPTPLVRLARAGAVWASAFMARQTNAVQAMIWMAIAGFLFSFLNLVLRLVALELSGVQAQLMRYICGLIVISPFIFRLGLNAWHPNGLGQQMWRGVVHTSGLLMWFTALPFVGMADITAIGFTQPIFVMLGAMVFLGERMVPARWVAAGIAFAGVGIVVAPRLEGAGGFYALLLLASAPVFAGSNLITKILTRRDRPEVIVAWQSLIVGLFTVPFAVPVWVWPSAWQWAVMLAAGGIGSVGQYCSTRAMKTADLSATQTIKFLELPYAAVLGLMAFGDVPSFYTIAGGGIIFGATTWIARRELRTRSP